MAKHQREAVATACELRKKVYPPTIELGIFTSERFLVQASISTVFRRKRFVLRSGVVFQLLFFLVEFQSVILTLLNMSLRDYFLRYKSILAYNNKVKLAERSDYDDACCGSDDSDIVVIGLLLLVTALLAYLLLAATVSSGRRKRELTSWTTNSTSFASNFLKYCLVINIRKWSTSHERDRFK
jgi:hypothetical protein